MRQNLKKKKAKHKKKLIIKRTPKVVQPMHYTGGYLIDPEHPVSINLIGCGGTGSQMLTQLGRIHASLRALGHPGFAVSVYDPDTVTEANMGRQLFSRSDIGKHKAEILVSRLNRFFGTSWNSIPKLFAESDIQSARANITITCTDNVASRKLVASHIKFRDGDSRRWNYKTPAYWLDLGNTKTTGQVVLGTFFEVTQPKKTKNTIGKLPTIMDMFPDLQKYEDKDTTPSCSLAEALDRQDLFINSILAQYGAQLIWKMFRELKLSYHGLFVNLDSMAVSPIMIKAA